MIKDKQDPKFLNQLKVEPLTKKNWNKFVKLLGDKGACENCKFELNHFYE
jgi:hypothetical protein